MKKSIFFFFLIFLLATQTNGRNLWAFLTYASFNSPEGPYVETYLTIAGNSVRYARLENGKFLATVNVLMTFKQNGEIKAFSKSEILSPELEDTLNVDQYFNHLERIFVPNGVYDFEILISDKNGNLQPVPYTQQVTVDFPADKAAFSGIELVKSYKSTENTNQYSKSGYDLIPYVFSFYPGNERKLTFYAELYNMEQLLGKEQKFLLSYYFESFESGLKLTDYVKMKKETTRPVNVILAEFNIENLASGNYNLVVEARNDKNELLASGKQFFQRINPNARFNVADILAVETRNTFVEQYTSKDTLLEYINCLYPIASGLEKAYIKNTLKDSDLHTMQQFFFSFWQQRNTTSPNRAWLEYKSQVAVAQENFGTTIKKGYQTDRGRVFLQYGPPNAREGHYNEPSTYPYEIWQYYTLNQTQRNKKFVFYSMDMVTADFTLLHSDAIGEVYEPRWKVFLRNKMISPLDIQDDQVVRAWGDVEEDTWELPTTNVK